MELSLAREKLDSVIQLSRVEMYKPIQIAEVLREFKTNKTIRPSELETYRNLSRGLRDAVTRELMDKVSTSSMRFQDDLWNESAVPPAALEALFNANQDNRVEEYIYQHVYAKSNQVIKIREKLGSTKSGEDVEGIFDSFNVPGLRNSADRLFEVFGLAVLQTQIEGSDFSFSVSGNWSTVSGNTGKKLISIAESQVNALELAKMGHTNAADAGLDIWTNFGVVVSVKNSKLNEELLLKVLSDTPVGLLTVICETVSPGLTERLGVVSKNRPVVIITHGELVEDAGLLLAKVKSAEVFTQKFISFFDKEFPLATSLKNFMLKRKYSTCAPDSVPWV